MDRLAPRHPPSHRQPLPAHSSPSPSSSSLSSQSPRSTPPTPAEDHRSTFAAGALREQWRKGDQGEHREMESEHGEENNWNVGSGLPFPFDASRPGLSPLDLLAASGRKARRDIRRQEAWDHKGKARDVGEAGYGSDGERDNLAAVAPLTGHPALPYARSTSALVQAYRGHPPNQQPSGHHSQDSTVGFIVPEHSYNVRDRTLALAKAATAGASRSYQAYEDDDAASLASFDLSRISYSAEDDDSPSSSSIGHSDSSLTLSGSVASTPSAWDERTPSSYLLGDAFRSSMYSDYSFSSIALAEGVSDDGASILGAHNRRDSNATISNVDYSEGHQEDRREKRPSSSYDDDGHGGGALDLDVVIPDPLSSRQAAPGPPLSSSPSSSKPDSSSRRPPKAHLERPLSGAYHPRLISPDAPHILHTGAAAVGQAPPEEIGVENLEGGDGVGGLSGLLAQLAAGDAYMRFGGEAGKRDSGEGTPRMDAEKWSGRDSDATTRPSSSGEVDAYYPSELRSSQRDSVATLKGEDLAALRSASPTDTASSRPSSESFEHHPLSSGDARAASQYPSPGLPANPSSVLAAGPGAALPPTQPLRRAKPSKPHLPRPRDSFESDLDVESLKLDGSSVRSSTSTIREALENGGGFGVFTEEGDPWRPPSHGSNPGLESRRVQPQPRPGHGAHPSEDYAPRRADTEPSPFSAVMAEAPIRAATLPAEQDVLRESPAAAAAIKARQQPPLNADATPLARPHRYPRHPPPPPGGTSHDVPPPRPTGPPPRHLQNQAQGAYGGALPPASHSSGRPRTGSVKPPTLEHKSSFAASTMSKSASAGSTSTTAVSSKPGGTHQQQQHHQQTPEGFLQIGIQHHESGDLSRSAFYFERSATFQGGCAVGMCMWGMALREGWGVRKDQTRGFEWIRRAAERAGANMSAAAKGGRPEEVRAVKNELKLSVFELGKCFSYGWGTKMDKRMALEYLEMAAKMGDPDAQAGAGELYASGKGCKKDLKKAAQYYRMAAAQGYNTVGLAWIYKEKYDE